MTGSYLTSDENPFASLTDGAPEHEPARIAEGQSLADYHASPEPSRSRLWQIVTTSPYEYRYAQRFERRATPAMVLGSAVDAAVLTPGEFETQYDRWSAERAEEAAERLGIPVSDSTAKLLASGQRKTAAIRSGKLWDAVSAESEARGVTILPEDDYAKAIELRDWIMSRKGVRNLFRNGRAQLSIYYTDEETGLRAKTRPDFVVPEKRIVFDVKTTHDLGDLRKPPFKLMRDAMEMGYHLQGAMQVDGAAAVFGGAPSEWELHHFWVRTKGAPWARLTRMLPEALAEGRELCREGLRLLKKCNESGEWPAPEFAAEDLPWETRTA